jgi:hypothetical protein
VIEPKQAVQFALQNLCELVGSRELADVDGIHLEELELSDDSRSWDVTLSYPVKRPRGDEGPVMFSESLAKLAGHSKRKWRTLRIDSEDGKLISMKLVGKQAVDQLTS